LPPRIWGVQSNLTFQILSALVKKKIFYLITKLKYINGSNFIKISNNRTLEQPAAMLSSSVPQRLSSVVQTVSTSTKVSIILTLFSFSSNIKKWSAAIARETASSTVLTQSLGRTAKWEKLNEQKGYVVINVCPILIN